GMLRARERLANERLVVSKPSSGSARLSWARENSNPRRTATRQQGFRCPSSKQIPLDGIKTRIVLENGAFEIVQKAGSPLAPGQGTELPEFRVFRRFCQFRRIQPAIGVRSRNMNIRGGDNQNGHRFDVRQRVN